MKTISAILGSVVLALAACSSPESTTAPGAVGSKKDDCCPSKAACATKCSDKGSGEMTAAAAPGAVGEKKSCATPCAEKKAACPAMTGDAAAPAPGAVSEKKSDCASKCSSMKSGCSASKTNG